MPPVWLDSLRDVPEIGTSPYALLGSLVSGPPLAPYGLIRRTRRTVFGRGTLYLEAMLCDSELAETVSKDGVELIHEFRAVAQLALRDRILAGRIPSAELRKAAHCEPAELSPLLFLEEQLVWAYMSLPDPAPECDRLLSDCLLSIVREDRHHILDWAAGALHRLPDLVITTPAGWLLSELCNALHRETRRLTPPPVDQIEPGLLREVLPLFPPALVGFYRDGTTLSLGPISRLRRTAFAVPGIALRPVTVTWTAPPDDPDGSADDDPGAGPDEPSPHERQELTVDVTSQVDLIPVGRSAVLLRNVAGAVVSLPSFESGTKAPELTDLDHSLDLLEDGWRNGRVMTAVVIRIISSTAAVVRFIDAWAISAYLRFEPSYLEQPVTSLVGSRVDVRISSFERMYQRILCRPVAPATWSAGVLSPGMRVEARFNNAARFGIFVEVPTTERGFEGPVVMGLVHNSELPKWWLSRVAFLEKGEPLQLEVLTVDQEQGRLNLTVADDRVQVVSQLSEGDLLTGRVIKLMPYGVMLEIPPGLDALLHNSEIAANQKISLGDEMQVQVVNVDHERTRIALATEPRLPAGAPHRALSQVVSETNGSRLLQRINPAISIANAGAPAEQVVAEFLRQQLHDSDEPIKLALLAQLVIRQFGPPVTTDWLGHEKFKLMLLALVPEAIVDGDGRGSVYLP